MTLKFEHRQIVTPGDEIATGDFLLGDGTYRVGEKIYSKLLGLLDVRDKFLKVIPLCGQYVPKPRDIVIGVVQDISFSNWSIDLNTYYEGVLTVANATLRYIDLNSEDISTIYGIGDVVIAKVDNVSKSLNVGLNMKDRGLFKVSDGTLVYISPTRVPRVIGKMGTMVGMLKDMTGCRITVGQNGIVWVQGEKSDLAVKAIKYIEENAHTQGLTERVKKMLEAAGATMPKFQAPAPVAAAPKAPAMEIMEVE